MQFLKSLVFNIFLFLGLIFIFIFAIPTLFLPSKYTLFFGRDISKLYHNFDAHYSWKQSYIQWSRKFKKVEKYFVASAHQSMFETFALQIPLKGPIFILKKNC